jgi:hypothetical protein
MDVSERYTASELITNSGSEPTNQKETKISDYTAGEYRKL